MRVFASFRRIAILVGGTTAVAFAGTGPTVERHDPLILVEAPSEVVVGESVRIALLVADEWGREGPAVPGFGVEAAIRLEISTSDPDAELPGELRLAAADHGRGAVRATFRTPGVQRVDARADGLPGASAPIRVLSEPPRERVYWGDLHAHLHTPGRGHDGLLDPGEFARILREGLEFGREVSNLDFAAFTPHIQTAGGLARSRDDRGSPWDALLRTVEAVNRPGEYVVFPGFEWQGHEGDHCVIYPAPGELEAPASFVELAESVSARGALLTAHAIFLPTRFAPRVPALVAVEVTRDNRSTERLGVEALRRGLVPAFLGGSDTHLGAIGATSLTGLRAPALTREAIFDAIRSRRTWATNGERIVLDFEVATDGELPLLRVRGLAPAAVDVIELFRDGRSIARVPGPATGPEFDLEWTDDGLPIAADAGEIVAYHAKVVLVTANRYDPSGRDLAISSPVAVTIPGRPPGAGARPVPEREPGPPVPTTPRAVALRREFEERWGYTKPSPEPDPREQGRRPPVVAALGSEPEFAGWRRVAGTEIPGHPAARAVGLAVSSGGKVVVAHGEGVLVVDVATGAVDELPYRDGRRHEPKREFCAVPLPGDRVLVRGADSPRGGWAAMLDVGGRQWLPVAPGPEKGTVADAPGGGYAWLVGKLLHRRGLDETDTSRLVEAGGRLLGFDSRGAPLVRSGFGTIVRLSPTTGEILERVHGIALGVDASGAVVLFAGLDARHPELGRQVRLERVLADGSRSGPWELDLKTSPVLDPPLLVAAGPDRQLFTLGGSTWWRREPEHDWWGATVDVWEPVRVGEAAAP